MHIPDGFIDGPTSVAGAVAAAGLVGASVKKAAKDLDDRQIPLAGLTAAFIFAMQMLNFPVANGTSGHLLGGCLAAVLVGPWVGSLCMTVVFIVQALVFADGGLTALGLNIILMGYVPCFVGYGIFLALRKALPASKGGVTASAAIAAWFGVVAASIVFTIYYAIGGTGDASVAAVGGAMVGVHVLVGIGEAVITGLTVGAVMAVRPDLCYGAQDLRPRLEVRAPATVGSVVARRAIGAFVAGGLVVALVFAFFVSPYASSKPDGLEKVSIDQGFDQHAKPQAMADGPLAGYSVSGVSDAKLSTGLAGVVGVALCFAIGAGGFLAIRTVRGRHGTRPARPASPASTAG